MLNSRRESSAATSEFATAPLVETITRPSKNTNNNSDSVKPKGRVNIRFLIAVVLFAVGLLLCIIAGVLTENIWQHSRGGSSKQPELKVKPAIGEGFDI